MAIDPQAQPKAQPEPAGGMGRRRRWIVFGSNVAVMILLATALVVLVVWLSDALLRGRVRGDWTAGGRFSLSPRTERLLDGLGTGPGGLEVRMTNLYSHTPEVPASEEQWRRVQDLLGEYDMASDGVEVDDVNPALDVGGVEQLIQRLTQRYAGELRKPKRLIEEYRSLHEAVDQKLAAEAEQLDAAAEAWEDAPPKAEETLRMVAQVWRQLAQIGHFALANVESLTEQALPAYADAMERATDYLGQVRQRFEVVPEALKKIDEQAGDAKVPAPVRAIIDGAEASYQPLLKRIKAFEKKAGEVREIELDEVRRSISRGETVLIETFGNQGILTTPDTDTAKIETAIEAIDGAVVQPLAEGDGHEILVPPDALEKAKAALKEADVAVERAETARRPDAIQVVGFDDIWVRNPAADQDPASPQRLFAGEQALSSALLGMIQKQKPAILFVTAGQQSATMPMPGPMGRGQPAPYRQIAERLEKANFIVQDWNVQRQPEMPDLPEASKVVLVFVPPAPQDPRMPMPPPSPEAYAPAMDLVRQGAPAILLGEPASLFQQAVPYAGLFEAFGVEARFNAVAVQSVVVDAAGKEEAVPQVQITSYADHEVTDALGALPTMMLTASPLEIRDDPPEGVTARPLIQLPAGADYWADTVVIEAMNRQATYDAGEDIRGPVPLAVAAERTLGGGETQKAVLFGDGDLATDRVAFYQGLVMNRGVPEMRYQFPGNAEVFVNACLWVSGGEHLIAVSPEAMEARRIGDLGDWRLPLQIFLIAGLPVLVLAAGLLVYVVRRG